MYAKRILGKNQEDDDQLRKLLTSRFYYPCFYPYPTPLICKLLIMNSLTRVLLKLNLPPAVLTYPLLHHQTYLKTLEKEEK